MIREVYQLTTAIILSKWIRKSCGKKMFDELPNKVFHNIGHKRILGTDRIKQNPKQAMACKPFLERFLTVHLNSAGRLPLKNI
jgi:hypothetical protein